MPREASRFFDRFRRVLGERHPEIDVLGWTEGAFGAVLRIDRQEHAIPLGEVFLRERAFPAAFPETLDRLVQEIRAHLSTIDELPFDEVVSRVLPQLRAESWLREHSPAFGPGHIVREPIAEDLALCWVLDEPDSMLFVTEGHLAAWGCAREHLANLALDNLERIARERGGIPIPAEGDRHPRVLHTGDGYDAARVLLAMRAPASAEGLLFAIPDRDTLVVSRSAADVGSWIGEIGVEYDRSEHPVSPRLYRVAAEGLDPID